MRAAIYVRVSTDHEEQKLSPEHQLAACKEYAEHHGMETGDDLVYSDAGLSGTEMENRPDVQRLLMDARVGKFDGVLFTAISRVARDMADALNMRKKLEDMYGIRLVSIEEGYDTAIPGRNSEMLFSVYAMLAAHKSREMSKAIRRGLRQSVKQGRHIGNRVPFGYTKTEDKRLVPDPASASIVRTIYNLYLQGFGSKAIAEELNRRGIRSYTGGLWQTSSINGILRNPVYVGKLVANKWRKSVDIQMSRRLDIKVKRQKLRPADDWVIVDNAHEPIIDLDTWYAVQNQMSLKGRHKGVKRNAHILSGLMRCATCGSAMIVRSSGAGKKTYKYVVCSAVARIGKRACTNHVHLRYDDVLQHVLMPLRNFDIPTLINHIGENICELLVQSTYSANMATKMMEIQRQLKINREREQRAIGAYTAGSITLEMLQRHVDDLRAESKRLCAELEQLRKRQAEFEEMKQKRQEIRETLWVIDNIEKYDAITVRQALSTLIDCIVVGPDRSEIVYKWDAEPFRQLHASLM